MTLTISGVKIGGKNPCRFVAELSNNHNGDFDRAIRLIDAAKAAGADFVKFQCYTPDELIELRGDQAAPEPWGSQGWTMRTLYEKAQTPLAWFEKLARHCEMRAGIPWFSSVFGIDSLNMLQDLGCPAYKIARLDNGHSWLLAAASWHAEKPTLISWDGTGDNPRDNLPPGDDIEDGGAHVGLLYCPPGYPQTHLDFANAFAPDGPFLGFSYHGTTIPPCVDAATLGAKLIEAHMMLEEEPSELESAVSLTQYQFAEMIASVRRVEKILA
jgi:pseudaminic acid synthase